MNRVTKKVVFLQPQNDASVAQLVEHLTLNQGVQGSTPCGSTKSKVNQLEINWLTFFVGVYGMMSSLKPCVAKVSNTLFSFAKM